MNVLWNWKEKEWPHRHRQPLKPLPFLQTTYEDWFITLYNVLYSSLPVLLVGLLDQVLVNRTG